MHALLSKIAIVLLAPIVLIGSLIGLPTRVSNIEQELQFPVLGEINTVAGKTYYLYGSGIGTTDSTVTLTAFKTPVSNYAFSMTDFGTIGYLTVEPGSATRQEFVSFTGITQNSDGTASLTGVTRGLSFVSPYTASTTLQKAHPGGSIVVISNPPQLYELFPKKGNTEFITGAWGFTVAPTSSDQCNLAGELCDYTYVNALAFQGVATATEATIGAVMLATKSQQALSTASSTSGAPLCLLSREADATYDGTKSNQTVITGSTNKIDANYIATTSDYTFTGNITLTGTTTADKIMAQNQIQTGKLIATSSSISLGGLNYTVPSSQGASSTVLTTNANGNLIWGDENPKVLLNNGSIYSTSGTATTTVTLTVPTGTMGEDDSLDISMQVAVSGTAAWNSARVEIGSGSATTTLVNESANNAQYNFEVRLFNNDSNSAQYWWRRQIVGVSTITYQDGTAAVNTANQFYVAFKISTTLAENSPQIKGLRVLHYRK